MEIYNEITVNRPVDEVFDFLCNFENMSKWNYYILKVTKITEGSIVKGAVFHQIRKKDSQSYRIIDLDFPRTVAVETLPPERRIIMRFELSATNGATQVKDYVSVKVPWLISVFIKSKIQSAIMENLQKLKILLETSKVTLQDGRVEMV